MAGKGDDRRPPAVPRETFEREWDRIFRPVAAEMSGARSTTGKNVRPPAK